MKRTSMVLVVVVVAGLCLYVPREGTARASSYVSGFRAAYLPVVATLHRITPVCATATRVEQLPACGAAIAPFRVALARLLRFVTHTTPPAQIPKADVQTLAGSIRVLQQRFATSAALIKQKNVARLRAMGGPGHAIDNAIDAFKGAVGNVVVDLPALRLPLP